MDTRAIPHPRHRLPLLGDLVGIDPRAPTQSSLRTLRGLGPISVRRVFGSELVTVGGAELVAELNDDTRFGKHVGLGIRPLRRLMGDALFTAQDDEPNWALAHEILLPAFTRDAMRGYHDVMLAVARELLTRWDAAAARGESVDVTADMTRLTLETIGHTGFGYRFGSFDSDRPHPFVVALARALRYFTLSTVIPQPSVRRLLAGSERRHAADLALMERIVDDVVDARRNSADDRRDDLLGMMLRSVHPAAGRGLDPVNIRRQVITFIVAGHETTSGALAFALYYLTRNPAALARAQAEVDALWGGVDDPAPEYTDIAKLRYVRAVLDEVLRLWPTAPGYLREAREDTVLGGRHRMSKGDWVLVMLPLLHRDPDVWPDPDRFDPDRFAAGQGERSDGPNNRGERSDGTRRRPPHAYKPFGTGQRACIGRQFALHEAVLALGLLLHRYRLEPDPDYRLKITESLTLKPRGFQVRPRRR